MSKIVKLFRNPARFFQDMVSKRLAANHPGTPTYVVGFSTWKQYMRKFFAERNLIFLPRDISEREFDVVWRKKIIADSNAEIFIWGFKAPPYILAFIKKHEIKAMFVEDGFVRSIQLGATKSPPMSLCLDTRTPYFNAREPSDLEVLLNDYDFAGDPQLLQRAERVIELFVNSGVSKYNNAAPVDIERIYGVKTGKRILVTGQVEDDASIEFGCDRPLTNNDVVRLAAQENPGAQIIYKPHPDVLGGHRASQSSPDEVSNICLVLRQNIPLAQALATVDHVYTITSLSGFEAALRGIKVSTLGCPFYSGWGFTDDRQSNARRTRTLGIAEVFAAAYILYPKYWEPETGEAITLEQAIQTLQNTAKLAPIVQVQKGSAAEPAPLFSDDGRIKTFAFHINDWKRPILTTWFPERDFYFVPIKSAEQDFKSRWAPLIQSISGSEIFIWGMNAPAAIKSTGRPMFHIEDGFIRSIGLGANHTPPLSLNLDSRTPYFDARSESDLERMLATYDFDADTELLVRAGQLMKTLLESGLSKYNHSKPVDVKAIYGEKTAKRVLVVGQVEDDASIKFGSARPYTNTDAVMIAAMENPGAQIIYKPHPDVLHKKRAMLSNPDEVRHICMVLEQDVPLAQSFETIDHVYTITSQAGFEALMRGIHVTTLGCPFYAGWGLTDARQTNARRTRKLGLLEVFAASYILYPLYFDPIYKIPLSAEQAVDRLMQMKRLAQGTLAEAPAEAAVPGEPEPIPTYVFGASPWRSFLGAWFPERKLIFMPKGLSKLAFDKAWRKKILKAERAEIFIWGAEVEPYVARFAEANGIKRMHVEDGFMPTLGRAADKTFPVALSMDAQAPHFDARKPTDLEDILNSHDFDADSALMARAEPLLRFLSQAAPGQSGHASQIDIGAIYGAKNAQRILVIGQPANDPSIRFGSARRYTNHDLVMIAAMENPGAQIIYKPHPVALNGQAVTATDMDHLCLVLDQEVSLEQAFETVDRVYTITSAAGFDALLRGIPVTTMGCPFYSGWGLTDDRQANVRRSRKLTLAQLVAAAYLLYAQYFDPIYKTRLSVEQVVERLIQLRSLPQPAPEPFEAEAQALADEIAVSTSPAHLDIEEELRFLHGEIAELRTTFSQITVHGLISGLHTDMRILRDEIAEHRSKINAA